MKIAQLCLRAFPHYRRDAFAAGLVRCGYRVRYGLTSEVCGDVLVIWNRYGPAHQLATAYEKRGLPVIVAENAYIPDPARFALSLNWHNTAGRAPVDDYPRHEPLRVEPWRPAGDHILVLPQRGIGPPGVAMPAGWVDDAVKRLQAVTQRRIVVRAHPGNQPEPEPLLTAVRGAHAVVTWASSAGIKAGLAGVPVLYDYDRWIAGSIGSHDWSRITTPERARFVSDLTWLQWSVEEIASGEPFQRLVNFSVSK